MKTDLQEDVSRAQKIARVQQAIANGSYDVSERAVADAVIRHILLDSIV